MSTWAKIGRKVTKNKMTVWHMSDILCFWNEQHLYTRWTWYWTWTWYLTSWGGRCGQQWRKKRRSSRGQNVKSSLIGDFRGTLQWAHGNLAKCILPASVYIYQNIRNKVYVPNAICPGQCGLNLRKRKTRMNTNWATASSPSPSINTDCEKRKQLERCVICSKNLRFLIFVLLLPFAIHIICSI